MGRFSSSLSSHRWAYSLADATARGKTGTVGHRTYAALGAGKAGRSWLGGTGPGVGQTPPTPPPETANRKVPGSPGLHSLCGSSLERMGWAPLTAAAVRVFTPFSAASQTVLTWGWLSLVEA